MKCHSYKVTGIKYIFFLVTLLNIYSSSQKISSLKHFDKLQFILLAFQNARR